MARSTPRITHTIIERVISRAIGVAIVVLLVTAARPAAAQAPSTGRGAGHQLLDTFIDSFTLLTIEHGLRIAFQEKTRHELGGPFWQDYRRSLRVPEHWEDGDAWWVNYIGHPMHGAAAGYIWLEHAGERHPDISLTRGYWASRAQAAAWAAVYSVQFEFGPLSEASIGNVGMHPATSGWVDHVVTPVGALALMVARTRPFRCSARATALR